MSEESVKPHRWQVIKEILADARERPKAQRQQWLEQACGEDRELLWEIAAFLALEDRLPGFIEEPILPLRDPDATTDADGESAGIADRNVGRRIGPYRLVRLIAKGGMGAVYLAEREEEFEQQVALKLVRRRRVDRERVQRFHGRRRADRELVERFHHERQILARLEHPNIARLLDGGTTEDGDPYFAMEWIQGMPIDHYCDEWELSTRQRLELILPVCSALALAHQNLVVHRDLKPGNILVDADGTLKLLDFGIAKLLDVDQVGGREEGLARYVALTPRYASPEQLRGQIISTASDVYSLGVVLHEILTGTLPPPAATLPGQAVTTVYEVGGPDRDPPLDGAAPAGKSRLDDDLRAIVGKALQPEPADRYASVERLAADLRRYLNYIPVQARQGGFVYKVGKFLRRHRLGAVNVMLMLVVAIAISNAWVRNYETERSRDQAREMVNFLVDLFLTTAPDRRAGEEEPTVRDLLDASRDKLQDTLKGQEPEVRARLLLRLGEVYSKWGEYEKARELMQEASALLRRIYQKPHPDLAMALNNLATVHLQLGDLATAETLFRESLGMRHHLGESQRPIKTTNNLATILMERGEFHEAEAIYRENLETRRALLAAAPDDLDAKLDLAVNLRSLATALVEIGDLDTPEPLLQESLDLRREIYGPDSPRLATVELSLGRLRQAQGRLAEADEWISRGLETRLQRLGEDHPYTALAQRDLAALRLEQGRSGEALESLRQSLSTLILVRPEDDPDIAKAESLLGAALAAERKFDEAEVYLRRGLKVLERRYGPEARDTRAARRRLEDFRQRL